MNYTEKQYQLKTRAAGEAETEITLCRQIPEETVSAFLQMPQSWGVSVSDMSEVQMERWVSEGLLGPDFDAFVRTGGEEFYNLPGTQMFVWTAQRLPERLETEENRQEKAVRLAELGLDESCSWQVYRGIFAIGEEQLKAGGVQLVLKSEEKHILGDVFTAMEPGQVISFTHPVTGAKHQLEISEYEAQALGFSQEEDTPQQYIIAMEYRVTPPLDADEFEVLDFADGRDNCCGMMYYGAVSREDDTREAVSQPYEQLPEQLRWQMEFILPAEKPIVFELK